MSAPPSGAVWMRRGRAAEDLPRSRMTHDDPRYSVTMNPAAGMDRWLCVWLLLLAAAGAPRQLAAQCAPPKSGVFYPAISAAYVGGTALLEGPLPTPKFSPITKFLRPLQRGADSKLVMTARGVEFYSSKLAGIAAGREPNYLIQTTPGCQHITIPYGPLVGLTRARKQPSDQSGDDAAYAAAAVGALTAAVTAPSSGRSKAWWGGGTAAALLVGYLALIRNPDQSENYSALFSRNGSAAPPGKDHLFPKADLLMFQVKNYHDYYNVSMILSARTGFEFTDETVVAGKDSGK